MSSRKKRLSKVLLVQLINKMIAPRLGVKGGTRNVVTRFDLVAYCSYHRCHTVGDVRLANTDSLHRNDSGRNVERAKRVKTWCVEISTVFEHSGGRVAPNGWKT